MAETRDGGRNVVGSAGGGYERERSGGGPRDREPRASSRSGRSGREKRDETGISKVREFNRNSIPFNGYRAGALRRDSRLIAPPSPSAESLRPSPRPQIPGGPAKRDSRSSRPSARARPSPRDVPGCGGQSPLRPQASSPCSPQASADGGRARTDLGTAREIEFARLGVAAEHPTRIGGGLAWKRVSQPRGVRDLRPTVERAARILG